MKQVPQCCSVRLLGSGPFTSPSKRNIFEEACAQSSFKWLWCALGQSFI